MKSSFKRTLPALFLLLVCLVGAGTYAYATEETDYPEGPELTEQSDVLLEPHVFYRTQAMSSEEWNGDLDAWQTSDALSPASTTDTPSTPLDSFALMLSSDSYEGGVEYRLAQGDDASSDTWLTDGTTATAPDGIHGFAARLTGDIANSHELWYRCRTESSGWLAWTRGGEVSGSEYSPIVEMQVSLLPSGEQPSDEEGAVPFEGAAETEAKVTADAKTPEEDALETQAGAPTIEYVTHVQHDGWQGWVQNGNTAGTSGRSLRLEGIRIRLKNTSGSVVYSTHVQHYGWLDDVSDGDLSGTTGESKRLEGITIELQGEVSRNYDVWYRTHAQTHGWLPWVKNGQMSGTGGQSKRLEAIQIRLVPKGEAGPSGSTEGDTNGLFYATHVQTYGWQNPVRDGMTAGTTGESKRLESMRISLQNADGGVQYRTHVQTYGWLDWVSNGAESGTTGQSKRLEALQIQLTGSIANNYDVWYRCHVQRLGWLDWACNGEQAGSAGFSYRMEGIQVMILPKGSGAPGSTETPFVVKTPSNTLNGVDISGWQEGIDIPGTPADFIIIKATEGVGTASKPATRYNPDYADWADIVLSTNRLLGFYHYANGEDPIAEADSFYEAIKEYRGRAIAVLDWEGSGNKTFNTGKDVTWCKKFLDRLRSRYGGTPFIYMSKSVTTAYDWSSIAKDYPLWGAMYASDDDVIGYLDDPWLPTSAWGAWGTPPTIYQYSSTGVLKSSGMDYLDINKFYGTREDWYRYL